MIAVARLRPHKRIDVLVEAFRGLDRSLVVVGNGALLEKLRATAPPNVRFAGQVSDAVLRGLYRDSAALLCPSVEEFGIVMAEAHAAGVPVIAPRGGGALDIVSDPRTGLLLDRWEVADFAAAVAGFDGARYSPQACRASAQRFSTWRFQTGLSAFLATALAEHPNRARRLPAGEPLATPAERSAVGASAGG